MEFFFDCSSPWTRLGFHNMQRLASELHVQVDYRSVLLGEVFNAVNPGVYEFREKGSPAKKRYVEKDLQDWAREAGLEIHFPNKVFPLNSVKVVRACIVAQERGRMLEFANAAFHRTGRTRSTWPRRKDSRKSARACVAAETRLADIERVHVRARLHANTDELIERGGFGITTAFIDGRDMYFGNDRLGLVRKALLRPHATTTT